MKRRGGVVFPREQVTEHWNRSRTTFQTHIGSKQLFIQTLPDLLWKKPPKTTKLFT